MVMRGMMQLSGTFDPAHPQAGISGTAQYQRDFYIFGDNVFGIAKKKVDSVYANSETRPADTTGKLAPLAAEATCSALLGAN
jgi:hypothetical protein